MRNLERARNARLGVDALSVDLRKTCTVAALFFSGCRGWMQQRRTFFCHIVRPNDDSNIQPHKTSKKKHTSSGYIRNVLGKYPSPNDLI